METELGHSTESLLIYWKMFSFLPLHLIVSLDVTIEARWRALYQHCTQELQFYC